MNTREPHLEPDVAHVQAQLRAAPAGQFWRSLDELANTDDFRNYLEREFPSQLAVWEDPIGRRRFLHLMGASLALAAATGCSRAPEEKIVPYVLAPEEQVQGKPQYFATAMPRCGDALGLLVESHMGRPIKIEGNPDHPASRGATDAFAQASLLTMYDPDRSQTVMHKGLIATWDKLLTRLTREMERLRARQGAGLRILTEPVTSPTLAGQLESLLEQLPEARWHQYEALHRDHERAGARLAFGRDVDTLYHFDEADAIVALDADFLANMPGSVRYARDFSRWRRGSGEMASMSRMYVVESTPTITGAAADHSLALAPHKIAALAQLIAARMETPNVSPPTESDGIIPEVLLNAIVSDLRASRGKSVIIAGGSQPPQIHALAHAMNAALGSLGNTISYIEPIAARPESNVASLRQLVEDMRGGDVELLLILGGNPVYQSPGELEFETALPRVPLSIHLSEYYDETSHACQWHVPAAHFLESWGDAQAYDGTVSLIQPLIAPLYGGKTAHELVAALTGDSSRSTYQILQDAWKERWNADDFAERWNKALHDGIVADSEAQSVEVSAELPADALTSIARPQLADDELLLEFRPDPTIADGRYANNGWLQELPKPLTKLTWDNVAMLSPKTADRLQVANGDVLAVSRGDAEIEAPAWIMPGQPDDCVSVTLGYGRTRAGRSGTGIGFDAYRLLPADGSWFAPGSVRKTGRKYPLATTQNHHSMEGRDIVRVTTFDRVVEDPHHLHDAKHHGELPSLYSDKQFNYDEQPNSWGMVIDQTACIGCNACVVACQAENNVPIVGKEQIIAGREMHWLRIDRYYHGETADPETYFQPMMCVHCEKAPCEVVCPVAATVHDAEGTNNMVYNRCVGTRYCSNNCPYKVRRFNFLQYSDEETPSLKLLHNPEVTVRSRGVMEKCTYCIQRISTGRIAAKKEGRAVAEGEVLTACQQACPTSAITFGNLNDANSNVNALKKSPLNYGVLADVNTQPRTTYLPRIVNTHPDLPVPSAATTAPHEERPEKDKAHS